MKIKEFIDRHERVKVIWEALQKNSDEQFRKRVLGTDCLNISVMENTNIDRKTGKSGILYQIEMGTWGDGFFAEYKKLLNYLYFADFFNGNRVFILAINLHMLRIIRLMERRIHLNIFLSRLLRWMMRMNIDIMSIAERLTVSLQIG